MKDCYRCEMVATDVISLSYVENVQNVYVCVSSADRAGVKNVTGTASMETENANQAFQNKNGPLI